MKNKNNEDIESKIVFVNVEDDLHTLELADILLTGRLLCLNFKDCPDNQANSILAFISGVNYATDGTYTILKPKIFLFGLKEDFRNSDLKEFIKRQKEINNG